MPDAGSFETDMDGRTPGVIGWGEAFAALPQATPDAGGWQRVQARLPAATRAPTRWPLWLATAASLLLALAIPLRMLPRTAPAAPAPSPRVSTTPAPLQSTAIATIPDASPSIASVAKPISTAAAHRDNSRRTTRTTPSQRPIRTVARPADATRIDAADTSTAADLEPLYAQSAQLEGLLAMARDDRVASGTAAALGDDLGSRMANIDAALIQPGLTPQRRGELWRDRVDTLRQLVGIETTQRLYAARGQRYDAALVSID